MRLTALMRILLLLFFPLLAACGGTGAMTTQVNPAGLPFDEARAFALLEHMTTKFPERRIGTAGAEECRQWIEGIMTKLPGWTIKRDTFTATAPEGARRNGDIPGVNLIARREGTVPGELWIASHYDTFDQPNFVGANDGGSSTVTLMELARCLAGEEPRQGMTVVMVWFDGEEKFGPLPWDDATNSTFGSRSLAERMEENKTITDINAFVLLDMVGDKQLGLLKESGSDIRLKRVFEDTARAIKDDKLFVGERDIKDDHIHFRRRGVPAIDLIDFNYGPGNRHWHSREDTIDKVSAESLGRVGRLVLAAIPTIEHEFRSDD